MTVYPNDIDDDRSLIRIDDNLSQLGDQAINQLRDAVFAIECELGITPAGSAGSVADRLDRSLTSDGDIKASALISIGLAALPIDNAQVGVNAGIQESKLALVHTTTDLYTQIMANAALLESVAAYSQTANTDLAIHISGGSILSDGITSARHVGSQIDLNAVPTDPRDTTYSWGGLYDKDGVLRTATQVTQALDQINTDLITHENATTPVHPATASSVDTSGFNEIPAAATNVQLALDAIDNAETLNIGIHRAVMHDNGVPKTARSEWILGPDGYSQNIVPVTPVRAYLVRTPATSPVDNNTYGDDVVVFDPDNTSYSFDTYFAQVKVGDTLRINYGDGIEGVFSVESIRFSPGTEWVVRLNGNNVSSTDGYDGYARIDRSLFDDNTYGVFACAAANNDIDSSIMSSIVVGHPRGATALGMMFDPGQLDTTHYLLYLHLYPTGVPSEHSIHLPGIDVTGDAGIRPGHYTIDTVVEATNDALRAAGYNYRFIAFNHNGNFGIMLADPIGNASFSIVNGSISGSSLVPGAYIDNVIGDAVDGLDALGLGRAKAALASPALSAYGAAEAAANYPTIVIPALKSRNAIINGVRRDTFATTYATSGDGYWIGTITRRQLVGATIEVDYTVNDDLSQAELKNGKTIVIQPIVAYTSASYDDVDYGRFIIKNVAFTPACGPVAGTTVITVVNGIHGTGSATSASSGVGLSVKLYFSEDSISFNEINLINASPSGVSYRRYHELYVTQTGNTFSHERARIPKQNESSPPGTPLLATQQSWIITDVSPKLRGYRDDDSDFRRYVRFYVLNYNTATGEYDGYIGRRDPLNDDITEFGDVTRGRKSIPTKFYDASNIDYIELMFFESGTASTNIMSTNEARYVDIELFTSLESDDEFFQIGTCLLTEKYVEYIRDTREFGTISEKNFSSSAISFIEAGDKYLHSNGVIQGLTYQGADVSDPSLLTFNGGMAVVNGHISTVNDGQIRIPEVYATGTVKPQSYNWAICVNDKDTFEAVLLTTSKQQFFAAGSPDFYVPSVTFPELIDVRKDLTPIAIVSVTISSVTINSVTDCRRFIADETLSIPFVLSAGLSQPYTGTDANGQLVGHFSTFEQLDVWVRWYCTDVGSKVVKIKGKIVFDATNVPPLNIYYNGIIFDGDNEGTFSLETNWDIVDCSVEFRNVIFSGDVGGVQINCGGASKAAPIKFTNCVFEFYDSNRVLEVDSYVIIKDCVFKWGLQSVPAGSEYVYSGNGAVYADISAGENIIIDGCYFTFYDNTVRPPYINFEMDRGVYLNDLVIRGCTFNEMYSGSYYMAAIAVVGTDSGTGNPPVLGNALISNNNCCEFQGIYITGTAVATRAIAMLNVRVTGNQCGIIGFYNQTYTGWSGLGLGNGDIQGSLLIEGNNVGAIASSTSTGAAGSGSSLASGNVNIRNNFTHAIYVRYNSTENSSYSNLQIVGNTVEAADLSSYPGAASGLTGGIAISAATNQSDQVLVNGNIVRAGYLDGTETLFIDHPIYIQNVSCIVTDNTIFGIADGKYGINVYELSAIGGSIISNNRLNADGNAITAYIRYYGAAATALGMITNNIFDSSLGGGEVSIGVIGTGWAAMAVNNSGQTESVTVPSIIGKLSVANYSTVLQDDMLTIMNPTDTYNLGVYTQLNGNCYVEVPTGVDGMIRNHINLASLIPYGAKLLYASFNYFFQNVTTPLDPAVPETGSVMIEIRDSTGTLAAQNVTQAVTASGTEETVRLPAIGNLTSEWRGLPTYYLIITGAVSDSNDDYRIQLRDLTLTYSW